MATRAESLVRQFCDNKKTTLQDAAKVLRAAIPDYVAMKELPPKVKGLITRVRQLTQEAEELKARLAKEYGFNAYELGQAKSRFTNPRREKAYDYINKQQAAKLATVERLRSAAYVQVMGRTPQEARIVVEELQKALAKV